MYIFELFSKIFNIKKRKTSEIAENTEENCQHIFVPIDSTKNILACSLCGKVVKINKDELPKINPFK